MASWVVRASAVTAFFLVFCIGLAVGQERERLKGIARWGQFTSEQVACATKADRK